MDARMPRIQVLSDLLVNKIAAGEVIERPASVVKELVENSLDAGARRVEIAVEQGGHKLIRVTDDGPGMDRDDLVLSVRPHATSKIRAEDDLFGIVTLGFRGEALASIGAVSQLRIVSRAAGADEAHEIRVTGDRVEPVAATSGPPGTTIEVRELFFNVPARQKFLRTAQTEMGHITEQLARIALVQPDVEFRLTHNGRVVHHLRPAAGLGSRVADFYGRELADTLLEINRTERGLGIHGLAAPPAESRSSTKWQYVFLNGRYIRDRFVSHAIREAYRGLIEANRNPVVFLAMTIDPAAVDVNVHPTKVEVRWRDSNVLYSQVLSALRDRFLNADLTPSLRAGGDDASRSPSSDASPDAGVAPGAADEADDNAEAAERRRRIRESIADFFKQSSPPAGSSYGVPGAYRPSTGGGRMPAGYRESSGSPRSSEGWPLSSDRTGHPDDGTSPGAPLRSGDLMPAGRGDGADDVFDLGPCPRVIQVHRSYLVAETSEGMVIIDQHALHERILFEQLSEQFHSGPLESQRMLIPEPIDVSPDQVSVIETHADVLHQLGFELTPYGPNTLAVHAAPTLLKPERVLEFLRDMLDRLSDRSSPASAEMLTNDLLSMMACKAAVKAGDPLTPEEIQALMSQQHRVARSSNCPHGRPTSLRLSIRELEKQFKRV
jgi:DNA mismatch repair protein MutL